MQMTDPSCVDGVDGSNPIQSLKILLDFNASFGGDRVVPKNLDGITSLSVLCSEVKVKIQEQFGPFKDMRLIMGGGTLDDERPLGDYFTEGYCRIVVIIQYSELEWEKKATEANERKLMSENDLFTRQKEKEPSNSDDYPTSRDHVMYPYKPHSDDSQVKTTNTPSTRKKRCCIS